MLKCYLTDVSLLYSPEVLILSFLPNQHLKEQKTPVFISGDETAFSVAAAVVVILRDRTAVFLHEYLAFCDFKSMNLGV